MLFGTRAGFGLEFHLERDAHLLCVDVFVGGLHVNTWDNAFYPPLLVKELTDELRRFRTPGARPAGFACDFLEWGECTNDVWAYAFPDGDWIHLACRLHGDRGTAAGTESVATVTRAAFVETLEQGLAVAEREWEVRRARLNRGG
ncbi:hypothetical protein OG407_23020 [Streptomyces sp. NBC_01515]|uniref:hypothetical protein n=1 Tax=Streptomyces sp. NBC_01515 TaxID=2903890 RepID=UPI00386412A0